jgi:hypothetical protein
VRTCNTDAESVYTMHASIAWLLRLQCKSNMQTCRAQNSTCRSNTQPATNCMMSISSSSAAEYYSYSKACCMALQLGFRD